MGANGFVEKMMINTGLAGEPVPGLPIIEIAGDRRLLIENHSCITEYGSTRIRIQVKFGQVVVEGSGMVLTMMTKERLVITGCIESVHLFRGC